MAVDIIILTKDKTDYLFKCLDSIRQNTSVDHHVYIGDTGSSADSIKNIVQYCKSNFPDKNVSLLRYNYYSFAKVNNHVVNNHCTNDVVLFCNNDIEFTDPCVDEMYKVITNSDNIGSVGCKLLFPNGTIQHAGQYAWVEEKQNAEWKKYFKEDKLEVSHRGIGQQNSNNLFSTRDSVMGNTGALMMINKQAFVDVGGFPEGYMECFEDVELNMRLKLAGYDNTYIGYVTATHHESVTRGKDRTAIMKLESDYLNNLFPYWNNLSVDEQLKLQMK